MYSFEQILCSKNLLCLAMTNSLLENTQKMTYLQSIVSPFLKLHRNLKGKTILGAEFHF